MNRIDWHRLYCHVELDHYVQFNMICCRSIMNTTVIISQGNMLGPFIFMSVTLIRKALPL